MGRALPNGSLVISHWVPADELEVGDIIVVRQDTDPEKAPPKMHRVATIRRNGGEVLVQTKGDANDALDPTVHRLPDRVVTAGFSLPYVGFLVGAIATPLGWLLLVLLPGLWLTWGAVRAIWSDGASGGEGRSPQPRG